MSQIGTYPNIHSLDEYIQAAFDRYTACIGELAAPATLAGISATARFHHLRLDGNGRAVWKVLAQNLAYHIISYCFSVTRQQEAGSSIDQLELRHEARSFFRDSKQSGEAGEILLYFLMESVLKAPQMVSKISLKTNSQLETNGSDGIHMKWNAEDGLLDVYFGEAKLYKSVSDGVRSAVKSIEDFHEKSMEEFELRLVTRHFKYAESSLKEQIASYVDRGRSINTVRVNHACLLGYDWAVYEKLSPGSLAEMNDELRREYLSESGRIRELLAEKFKSFESQRLRFEIFVLPFSSIDDFREEFLNAL